MHLLKLFSGSEIVPFDLETEKIKGKGFYYKNEEFVHYSELHHSETAFHRFSKAQTSVFILFILLIILGLLVRWHFTVIVILATLTILYFIDLLFNFFIIFQGFTKEPEIRIAKGEIENLPDSYWPTYTIFCPLYKEWQVIPQFVEGINNLNYPMDKLQVILLLKEDDKETIDFVQKNNLPKHITYEIIPHSKPKTKPKACNYGLTKATGEFVVVYDAEDVPEPDQLKKAVIAFRKVSKETVCIQAKLTFYNPHHNILTRVFTAEYALWFDLVLTGLQSLNAPIPLGGTSNHFRRVDLIKLGVWDSFNVTEDCDLGIRLAKKGFKTAIIESTTLEEANSNLLNWFNQRTRWIKGYMQTYLVHSRDFGSFPKKYKDPHMYIFQLVVGGKVLSALINPFMWIITFCYFLFRAKIGLFIESFFPGPVLYMGVICFIFGNFMYMYYYMIGCAKKRYDNLIKFVYLTPFYWLIISIAAWRALFQLIYNPHYWFKTKHGLHLNNKKASQQAIEHINHHSVMRATI